MLADVQALGEGLKLSFRINNKEMLPLLLILKDLFLYTSLLT